MNITPFDRRIQDDPIRLEAWINQNVCEQLRGKKKASEKTENYIDRVIQDITRKMPLGHVAVQRGKIVSVGYLSSFWYRDANKQQVKDKLHEYFGTMPAYASWILVDPNNLEMREEHFQPKRDLLSRSCTVQESASLVNELYFAREKQCESHSAVPHQALPVMPIVGISNPQLKDLLLEQPKPSSSILHDVQSFPPIAPPIAPLLAPEGSPLKPQVSTPEQLHAFAEQRRLARGILERANPNQFYAITPPPQDHQKILETKRSVFKGIASSSNEKGIVEMANAEIRKIDRELEGTKKYLDAVDIKEKLEKYTNDELMIVIQLFAENLRAKNEIDPEVDLQILEGTNKNLFELVGKQVNEMPILKGTPRDAFGQFLGNWEIFLHEQAWRIVYIVGLLSKRLTDKIEVKYEPKPYVLSTVKRVAVQPANKTNSLPVDPKAILEKQLEMQKRRAEKPTLKAQVMDPSDRSATSIEKAASAHRNSDAELDWIGKIKSRYQFIETEFQEPEEVWD